MVATVALASLAANPAGGARGGPVDPRRALIAGLVVAAAGSVMLALASTARALFGAAGAKPSSPRRFRRSSSTWLRPKPPGQAPADSRQPHSGST